MEEKTEETLKKEEVNESGTKTVTTEEQTTVKVKKKRSPLAILLNIVAFLFLVFIIFETVIAFLNFNLVKQNKEPSYFVTTKKETRDGYDYTIYDMGIYKIVRKENTERYETKLLPFFLDM